MVRKGNITENWVSKLRNVHSVTLKLGRSRPRSVLGGTRGLRVKVQAVVAATGSLWLQD